MKNKSALMNRTSVALLIGVSALTSTIESRAETATFRRGDPDPIVGGSYDGVEDAHIVQNNDYLETPLTSFAFDSTTSGYIDLVLDPSEVGALIDDWTTGTNAGLFLITAAEDNDEIAFHSSEAATLEDRPQLIIDFVPKLPTLEIIKTASGVRLSWAGGGTRWTLNSSADLKAWEPITEIPTPNDGGFHVDLPVGSSDQFFRLENE